MILLLNVSLFYYYKKKKKEWPILPALLKTAVFQQLWSFNINFSAHKFNTKTFNRQLLVILGTQPNVIH